jgi:hypothetical protein
MLLSGFCATKTNELIAPLAEKVSLFVFVVPVALGPLLVMPAVVAALVAFV